MDFDIIKYPYCRVKEEKFPQKGKCFHKNSMGLNIKICPFCNFSTSLPVSKGLKVAIIIECSKFGYGFRITE